MFLIISIITFVMAIFALIAILAVWTYKDAKSRGLNAAFWTAIVTLGQNLTGFIIYHLVARKGTKPSVMVKTRKFLTAFLITMVILIGSVGIFIWQVAGDNFAHGFEYSYSVGMLSNSYGNIWNLSYNFSNASFEKTIYTENGKPAMLFIDGSCKEGVISIAVISSGYSEVFEINGERNIELPENGKIKLFLVNDNVTDGNVKIHWE